MSRIQTRLQTGAISRKNYATFLASLPELQTLQLDSHAQSPSDFSFIVTINDSSNTTSFRTAATNVHWQTAMQEEFEALQSKGTWVLVPPPTHRSIISSKWVFKRKKIPDGFISRYKARLVAQGYNQ